MIHRSTLPLICIAGLPAIASAQLERQVQIRSIDFATGVIELHNFAGSDIDLSGWRFCSHDFDDARRYSGSGGFDGVVIEAGTSVSIYFNDDAPAGDPDSINRADLGGFFATPLDQDAYGLQLYFPGDDGLVSFGRGSDMVDHIQWNIDGSGAGAAEFRTGLAVDTGLWTAIGDFIATGDDTARVTLTDTAGGLLHGPDDYDVAGDTCPADLDGDGELSLFDFLAFQNLFDAGDPAADFDGDGELTLFDFLAFQNAFDAGCP